MKRCKYVLFSILLLVVSISQVYADDLMCYYMGDGFRARYNATKNDIDVNLVGFTAENDSEKLGNYCNDWGLAQRKNTTESGHEFTDYLDSACIWSGSITKCPEYLVFQYCNAYRVWGTESASEAKQAMDEINNNTDCKARMATFKNSDGSSITEDQYYSAFITPDIGGEEIIMDCNQLFGDVDDAGIKKSDGTVVRPASLAYLIDQVLTYVRIIVPILIILLGSLDLAKAVVASKEEQIKKARADFAKRVAMGVVIFFVPTLVNIIMKLADIVWEGLGYTSCTL